jgi:hypothetical protein
MPQLGVQGTARHHRSVLQEQPAHRRPGADLGPDHTKVRLHLTWLSVCARPFVAHQAAVAARDLVRMALAADPVACLMAIAEEVTHEPVMYSTHQCLVEAARAFGKAASAQEQMRPALQMYAPVMEGDIRRVARVVLRLLGRHVDSSATLAVLAEQLAAQDEPIGALLAPSVRSA